MSQNREALTKEPLNILINPDLIKKQKPWQVDITQLLDLFLTLLEKLGAPDLRLCGSVALSSALIYRLKVETLFLFEKLREEKRSLDIGEIPQMLVMPIRYELQTATADDLILALQTIIEEIVSRPQPERTRPTILEPQIQTDIEQFVLSIKENVEPLRAELHSLLASYGKVLFTTYTKGMSVVDQARIFILLLFLAMDGVVFLEQAGDDIIILGAGQVAIQ
jgi:segregation and condensation protein A